MRDLLGITVLAAVSTLPFLIWPLDIASARAFLHAGSATPWSDESLAVWKFLYAFGPWLAIAVGIAALAALAAAAFKPRLIPWRPHLLYLVLTLILGPGLIVNVIFKDHWGRPRPRQVQELGGQWQHQQVFERGIGGRGKSFPCGHSSMGYYFIAFYFLARRRHRGLAFASLAFAGVYGTLIGVGRMAAGAHFLSDVLWSAVFTAATAFVLYYFVIRIPEREDSAARQTAPPSHPYLTTVASVVVIGLTIGAGLLATPVYKEFRESVPLSAAAPILFTLDTTGCDLVVHATADTRNALTISGEMQGFGWPASKIRGNLESRHTASGREVAFSIRRKGFFSELTGQLRIEIPVAAVSGIVANVRQGDVSLTTDNAVPWPPTRLSIREGTLEAPTALPRHVSQSKDGATDYLIPPPR